MLSPQRLLASIVMLAAALASSCTPDAQPCTSPLDCFSDEQCVSGVCLPPDDVRGDAGDDTGESDAADATDPGPTFVDIIAHGTHACALTSERHAVCWGDPTFGKLDALEDPFVALALGWHHSCGLRPDSMVRCWGESIHAHIPPSDATFERIASGSGHLCGINAGQIRCFGNNDDGQRDIPDDLPFATGLGLGDAYTCALLESGAVRCWGDPTMVDEAPLSSEAFASLYGGELFACALDAQGLPTCWGSPEADATNPPEGPFEALALGQLHGCGLRPDGSLVCWGNASAGKTEAPLGDFIKVAAGEDFSCALTRAGAIECWGANLSGQTDAPTLTSIRD